jgi:hypothetical protein
MALPDLNWRYVGVRVFPTGNLVACQDALYDLGIATNYADGTARVPGTGSAWTWAREQILGSTVACYGNPPVNALNFRYIVGGTVALSAPPMLAPDTAVANVLFYGMQRNAGAYTTWTSATPFTNAGFSRYWRATTTFGSYDSVALWESQEGCAIQWGVSSVNATYTTGFGALIDPLSVDPSNAENDGRLYMMFGAGQVATSGAWASIAINTPGNSWGAGTSTANNAHSGVFVPGTATMFGTGQTYRFGTFAPTSAFHSTNGESPLILNVITSSAQIFLGQSRQWYITDNQQSRIALNLGGTAVGWICGSSINGTANCVVLTP